MSWPRTHYAISIGDEAAGRPIAAVYSAIQRAADAVMSEAEKSTVWRIDSYETGEPEATPVVILTKPTPKVVAP